MATPEEEFVRYHDRLRRELNMANWHFRVIGYIGEIQGNYVQELNQAPAFWGLTITAHIYSTLTRLNNFFWKQKTRDRWAHLHMYSFLDFIEQNLDIFSHQAFERRLRAIDRYDELAEKFNSEIAPEKVARDRRKLKDLPIPSLRAWRNRILSHIDKDDIAQSVDSAKRHPIQMKHIAEIIDTLHEMLNEYSLAYDFSEHSKDLTIEHGIKYILDAVKFKLQS